MSASTAAAPPFNSRVPSTAATRPCVSAGSVMWAGGCQWRKSMSSEAGLRSVTNRNNPLEFEKMGSLPSAMGSIRPTPTSIWPIVTASASEIGQRGRSRRLFADLRSTMSTISIPPLVNSSVGLRGSFPESPSATSAARKSNT